MPTTLTLQERDYIQQAIREEMEELTKAVQQLIGLLQDILAGRQAEPESPLADILARLENLEARAYRAGI